MIEWDEFKERCPYLIIDLISGKQYCRSTKKECDYRDCPAAVPKPPRIRKSLFTGETWAFVTGEDGKTHGINLGRQG